MKCKRQNELVRTSVDGGEQSFSDQGYEPVTLNEPNELDSPRMIASKKNENVLLTDLPGNKSFTLDLEFFSDNSFVSPLVDLDRVQAILTSNRVNSPVSDFSQDR